MDLMQEILFISNLIEKEQYVEARKNIEMLIQKDENHREAYGYMRGALILMKYLDSLWRKIQMLLCLINAEENMN